MAGKPLKQQVIKELERLAREDIGPQATADTYAVVRQGVYMQGIWGPFASVEEARTKAISLASEDADGYHSYDVCPLSPNAGHKDSGGIGNPVARYRQESDRYRQNWIERQFENERKIRESLPPNLMEAIGGAAGKRLLAAADADFTPH